MADAVRQRRAQAARWIKRGKRAGGALLLVAVALVVAALATGMPTALVTAATVALITGAVVLAPAMVFGYGVNAAERDDRARGL